MPITAAIRSIILPREVITKKFRIKVTFNSATSLIDSDIRITDANDSDLTITFRRIAEIDTSWNIEITPPKNRSGTLNIVLGRNTPNQYNTAIEYDTLAEDASNHRTVFYKILEDINPPENIKDIKILYREVLKTASVPRKPNTTDITITPTGSIDTTRQPLNWSYDIPDPNPEVDDDGNIKYRLYGIVVFSSVTSPSYTTELLPNTPVELGRYKTINSTKYQSLYANIEYTKGQIWQEKVIINHFDPGFSQINTSIENRGSGIHEALDGTRSRYSGLNSKDKYTFQFTGQYWPKDLVDSLRTFYNTELNFGFSQNLEVYPDRVFPALFENLELGTTYGSSYTGSGYNVQFTVTQQ